MICYYTLYKLIGKKVKKVISVKDNNRTKRIRKEEFVKKNNILLLASLSNYFLSNNNNVNYIKKIHSHRNNEFLICNNLFHREIFWLIIMLYN